MASNKSGGKSLSVSRSMTAPTIGVKNETELSGMGLALVGTTVEQDAAYVSLLSKNLFYYQTCAQRQLSLTLCLWRRCGLQFFTTQWECHIEIPGDDKGTAYELMFGVATKKDRKFYDALAEQEEGGCTQQVWQSTLSTRFWIQYAFVLNIKMLSSSCNVYRKSRFEWYGPNAKDSRKKWFCGGCCRPAI